MSDKNPLPPARLASLATAERPYPPATLATVATDFPLLSAALANLAAREPLAVDPAKVAILKNLRRRELMEKAARYHLARDPGLLASPRSEIDLETWEAAQAVGIYHLQEAVRVQRLEGAIKLRFTARGVPVIDDGAGDRAVREQQETADESALIECFKAAEETGATVPTGERGSNTTWHALSVFSEFPATMRKDKSRFREGIARLARSDVIRRETYRDHRRHACERYVLSARVCASFESGAELAQPPQSPVHPMREFRIGGMGELARAQSARVSKVAQPTTPERLDEISSHHPGDKGNGGDEGPPPGSVWNSATGKWESAA